MEADNRLAKALVAAKKAGDTERVDSIARIISSQHNEQRAIEREPATELEASRIPENLAPSMGQYIMDTASAITNPIDTVTGLAKIAGGAASKIPLVSDAFPSLQEYEPMADSVSQFYKDKYGSWDKAGASLTNDPVGTMADASVIGGVIPRLSKFALATNPASLAYNTGKKALQQSIPADMPSKQYQSAVNFDTVTSPRDKERMVQAALDHGILPNSQGVDKAMAKIAELGEQIRQGVSSAEGSVPRQAIYQGVPKIRKDVGGTSIEAPRDLKLVNDYVSKYNQYLDDAGLDKLNASQLQELKQSVWGEIYSDRVKQTSFNAVDKTREAIAQKAGSMIDELAPGTKDLNRQQGSLLELMKQLPKKAQRIANRNNVSLASGGNTLAGYAVGNLANAPVLGTAIGAGMSIMDMPMPKARMAIMAHRLQNNANIMTTNRALPTLIRELGANLNEYEREN